MADVRQRLRKIIKIEPPGVIPGFGLVLGITLTMLTCIVLIPLASLVLETLQIGSFQEFWEIVTDKYIMSGYKVSLLCAFLAAVINTIMGVIIAWILVRYKFPGKTFVNGIIELPFAIPTSVAGIALTSLYADTGWIGSFFAKFGIAIAYTKAGIIIAMVFIGIPFVVRSVQPVLEKFDNEYEEAAMTLGASKRVTFFKVILPELFPSILAGFGLAFARGIGEYGSVVFIAGNIPLKTQIAPLLIYSKLQQYKYEDATAIALVLLIISFVLMLIINGLQLYMQRFASAGDNMSGIRKVVEIEPSEKRFGGRQVLIFIGVLFLVVMLIVPLALIIIYALRDGWASYVEALIDAETIHALKLTLIATVIAVAVNTIFGVAAAILLTKYVFPGRQVLATLIDLPFSISPVIAGLIFLLTFGSIGWMDPILSALDIQIVFAVPGIVLATIFVTFPFVFRELFPVLNAQGRHEEEAAALMGARPGKIFRKITFPHMKWAFAYGIVLCAARAMGEFGAVSVISGHLRGKTNTLSLHVEILFNEFNTTASFAVASLLVVLAVIILIVRNVLEYRIKKNEAMLEKEANLSDAEEDDMSEKNESIGGTT